MSGGDRRGGALDIVREVLGAEDNGGSGATFMRGLTLGALLGAAIAGSALWRRARTPRRTEPRVAPPPDGDKREAGSAGS